MALSQAKDETTSGFAVLDDKGRLPVAKALRDALGLKPGSSVAYVLIDGLLLIIPQDEQLEPVMHFGGRLVGFRHDYTTPEPHLLPE